MNWKKLQSMECPKCSAKLIVGHEVYSCSACDFKIREKKFNEVVESLYKPKHPDFLNRDIIEDNQAELNNLEM